MAGVANTVVSGIQEISALLPLLGTEQCEEHVGSALYKGFIYVCISPISIFGSLGIVRAGFNIFLASLNIQPIRFLGAKKLNDGGFYPKGAVAPMIALDPKHPNRFLVESKLEAMLADENIENVGDLTVSWDEGNFLWNFKLVVFTLLSTPLGLMPYLYIILKHRDSADHSPFFLAGWGFPIMRVLGSALCVVVVQFLIQIRVLVIIRMRLLFMSMDRIAKDMNINLDSKQHNLTWNSHSTSETCLWDLEKWLTLYGDEEKNGTNIKRCYESARRRQFPPESRLTRFIRPSADFIFHFLLAIGIIISVIGYIGCFNLVSNSQKSAGPVIWVALEALLSVLRIIVWAFNPSWDDSKGITFNLKLASHSPLITCSKSDDDIKADGMVSATRGNGFLEEIVAYTGPLPSFNWNNVALYYILTAGDAPTPCPLDATLHAILYVVISDYKEQTCRILTKRPGNDEKFDIYISSLESDPRSTVVNVKFKTTSDGKRILTLPKTHSLTADTRFMDELARHYDKIISQVQKRRGVVGFRTTWNLRRPDEKVLKEEQEQEEEKEKVEDAKRIERNITEDEIKVNAKNEEDEESSQKDQINAGLEEKTDEEHEDENSDDDDHGEAQLEEEEDEASVVSDRVVSEAGSSKKDSAERNSTDRYLNKSNSRQWYLQLTPEDVIYIRQGQVERRRRELFERLEEWVELFIALYNEELFQDVPSDPIIPPGESVTLVQKYEANEVEYLLIECRTQMERLLDITGKKWDSFVQTHHGQIVTAILEHTFPVAETKKLAGEDKAPDDDIKHYERTRREKMRARLVDEWQRLHRNTIMFRAESVRSRLDAHVKASQRRIHGRKYDDSEAERLLGIWNGLLLRAPSTPVDQVHQSLPPSIHDNPTNNHTKVVETITDGFVCPEYTKDMEDRFTKASEDLGRKSEETHNDESAANFDRMKDRCRKRAQQLFTKIKDQTDEFKALDNVEYLTADVHNKRIYWSKDGLQERRRMMDRAQKNLVVSDSSIDKIGGVQNMIRALKISQEFVFLDFNASKKLTAEDIKQVVIHVKSLAGVTFRSPDGGRAIQEALLINVRSAIEGKKDTCFYQNVFATDHYRKGRPYIVFPYPKWSSCTVVFRVHDARDHILTLKHCMTTSSGRVDIDLNGQVLDRTWGLSQESKDHLVDENILLPSANLKVDEPNMLTITLAEDSEGVYWLSDVFFPARVA